MFFESKDNFHWLEITKVSGDASISKVTVITIHYFIIKKNNNYRFNSIAYNVKNSNLLPPICLSPQRGQVTAAVSFVFRLTKGNGSNRRSCRESYVGKKNTMFID